MRSKRQTTMAKLTRERKVQERRDLKRERKQAARDEKAAQADQPAPDPSADADAAVEETEAPE